jgi:hypothetical protein
MPVLARRMREQTPVLADTAQRLRGWLDAHPGERIPRAIGVHEFEVEADESPAFSKSACRIPHIFILLKS